MKLEPLSHPTNICTAVLLPSWTQLEDLKIKQDIWVEEDLGYYYSVSALLRKYSNNPPAICFIADML